MSDGERVIFYVIGQALAAPTNGIVVVDEPEIHLHRAIQSRLWDAIEQARPDCLFVYITHDLDFAATRIGMPKVWIKGYNGSQWDWHVVPRDTGLPEELLLTVVGSRKPILFCEGHRGSLDHAIYSHVYDAWTVVPCGNCDAVIHATRSFLALRSLHNLNCAGIIDRDRRSDEELTHLGEMHVFASTYSEAENLLASAPIVRAVASHLARSDVESVVARVEQIVFEALGRDKSRVSADLARARIETMVGRVNAAGVTRDALVASANAFVGGLDAGALYDESLQEVERILSTRDISRALQVYHNKGLVPQIGPILGLKPTEYTSLIKRLIAAGDKGALVSALRSMLPQIKPAEAPSPKGLATA